MSALPKMLEEASELRAGEADAKGLFRGGLFGMVGMSLMAVLWVGGSHVGDGSMTVSKPTVSRVACRVWSVEGTRDRLVCVCMLLR